MKFLEIIVAIAAVLAINTSPLSGASISESNSTAIALDSTQDGLSTTSSLLTTFIDDVNILIGSTTASLGTLYPIILGPVSSIENDLQNIISTIAVLEDGTFSNSQIIPIFANLLNNVATGTTALLTNVGIACGVVGDIVALSLFIAFAHVGEVALSVISAVSTIANALASSNTGSLASAISGAVSSLSSDLQIDVHLIQNYVINIVGGLPTGALMPQAGFAQEVLNYVNTNLLIYGAVLSTTVIAAAPDLVTLAANISNNLSKIINFNGNEDL